MCLTPPRRARRQIAGFVMPSRRCCRRWWWWCSCSPHSHPCSYIRHSSHHSSLVVHLIVLLFVVRLVACCSLFVSSFVVCLVIRHSSCRSPFLICRLSFASSSVVRHSHRLALALTGLAPLALVLAAPVLTGSSLLICV
jgi:hypothetical protein